MKKNTLTKKNKLFFLFTSGICSTLLLSSCNVLYNHVDGTVPINNIKSSDITIPLLVENVSNIKESELSSINENKNLNKAIYDEIRTVRPDIEYGDFAISENVEPGGPVPEYVFCKVSSAPKTVQKKIFGEYTKKVFLTPIVKKIDISVLTKSFTDSINIDINVANCKNVTDNELISLLNTNPAVINRVQIALNLLDTLPEMNDIMISNNFSSGDYSKYPTYEGSFSIQAKSSSQIYTGNFYFRTTITIYEVKKTISAVTLTQDISLTLHTTQPQSIS
jgi:hypothetical protein